MRGNGCGSKYETGLDGWERDREAGSRAAHTPAFQQLSPVHHTRSSPGRVRDVSFLSAERSWCRRCSPAVAIEIDTMIHANIPKKKKTLCTYRRRCLCRAMGLNWLVDSNNRWIVFTTSCHLLGMGAENKKKKTGGNWKGGNGGGSEGGEGGFNGHTHSLSGSHAGSHSGCLFSLLISSGHLEKVGGPEVGSSSTP